MGRGASGVIVGAVLAAVAIAGLVRRHGAHPSVDARTSRLTPYGVAHPAAPTQTATFAAGCFWKLEHAMRRVDGVVSTTAGYTGGPDAGADPTHASVSAGRTGHAEAVLVTYDQSAVSYEKLLDTFWSSHDPAQFAPEPEAREEAAPPMPGRSIIFYHSPGQGAAAEASKQRVQRSGRYASPIPTEILPATQFHPAEVEHQQFLEKHGAAAASCRVR